MTDADIVRSVLNYLDQFRQLGDGSDDRDEALAALDRMETEIKERRAGYTTTNSWHNPDDLAEVERLQVKLQAFKARPEYEELEAEVERLQETERKLINDVNFLGKRLVEEGDEVERLRGELDFCEAEKRREWTEVERLRKALRKIDLYPEHTDERGTIGRELRDIARQALEGSE